MAPGLGLTPYIVMLFILLICIIREFSLSTTTQKKINLCIALIPVFFLLSFKSASVGTDTHNYLHAFSTIGSEFGNRNYEDYRMEIGFQYFMVALRRLFDSDQSLFIAVGLFTSFSLYHFIQRTATSWCLALYFFICLGFFGFSLTGIRQTIAIDITLLAFPLIKDKKLLWFLCVIGIATLFHKSAVVAAPLYWISNMTVNRKNTILMIILMTSTFFMAEDILLETAEMLEYDYGIEETDNGGIFLTIVLLISILAFTQRNFILGRNPAAKHLFNSNYVSVLLWIIRMISRTVERVSFYFMPYTYVLFEQSLSSQPKGKKGLFTSFAILLATILFIYRISKQPDLNDYSFFWQ